MAGNRAILKEKAIAVFLGLIVTLVVAEVALRLVGAACEPRDAAFPEARRAGSQVILCLGDSFTWGMGAGANMNWPRQLERMLNEGGGQHYVVVNRGMSGQNTAWLLQMLQHNLDTTRPDLVILCSGSANRWDSYGAPPAVAPPGESPQTSSEPEPGPSQVLRDGLYRVRVFRLARLVYLGMRESREKAVKAQRAAALEAERKVWQDKAARAVSAEQRRISGEWWTRGWEARRSRGLGGAIECFLKGIEANPHDVRNYLAIAECHEAGGDFPKVLEWCRKAREVDPYSPDVCVLLAKAYIETRRHDEAVESLVLARELAPDHPMTLTRVSNCYARMQRYSDALECLGHALSRDPRFRGFVLQERATVYAMMREYDRAIADAQEALRAGVNRGQGSHQLGSLLLEQGEPARALPYLEEAARIQPDSSTIRSLARCYKDMGRVQDALEAHERLATINPADGAEDLADFYRELGRESLAMAWYSKAIEARPGGRVEGILHKMRGPARPHRFRWGPAPPPAESELVLTPVEAWIRADLATAVARCRESGALVLMHDYPIDDVRSDVLRAIASENQVPFVDHHPSFRALAEPENYFAPDTHCNDLGYEVMARDLKPKVLEMLSSKPPRG